MRKLASLVTVLSVLVFVTAQADQRPAPTGHTGGASKQPSEQATVPAPGEYKQLNPWTKLKLGAAVFTNPQVVRNAKFAYLFNPTDFEKPGTKEKILLLAKEGKIGFGIPSNRGDVIKVISLQILEQYFGKGPIDDTKDLSAALTSTGGQVVAGKEKLLGTKARESLIKSPEWTAPQGANHDSEAKDTTR